MEEGTKTKKTIFVGGIGQDVDESVLLETFATFGDVIEIQIPPATTDPNRQTEERHKGYGFITYSSPADAQDAIDNMDLNELRGSVLKVNLARPTKIPLQADGNRAIWESEAWLKQHVKPLEKSGGAALRANTQSGSAGAQGDEDEEGGADGGENNAMEE